MNRLVHLGYNAESRNLWSGFSNQSCTIIIHLGLPESVVDEVAGDHLVEEALPVAVPPRRGEALDLPAHLEENNNYNKKYDNYEQYLFDNTNNN